MTRIATSYAGRTIALLGLSMGAAVLLVTAAKAEVSQIFRSVCQEPQATQTEPDLSTLQAFSPFDMTVFEMQVGSSIAGWKMFWLSEPGGDYVMLRQSNEPPTCTLVSTTMARGDLETTWDQLRTNFEARGDEDLAIAAEDQNFQATGFLATPVGEGAFLQTHLAARGNAQDVEVYLSAVTLPASEAACELYPERCN